MIQALLLALLFFSSTAVAETLQEIDTELNALTLKLQELRKEEFNTELQGQDYMRSDWADYARNLTQGEQEEHQADKIAKRIAELQAKKQALLKQQPSQ